MKQGEEHYALPPGLSLREELPRYFRIVQALHERFTKVSDPGPTATANFLETLLKQAFGFDDLVRDGDGQFSAGDGRVPVVVVPPVDALDRPSEVLSGDRRRSAAGALQDRLNAEEEALWGLAANGPALRLMRDNRSLTRPAYLEADLTEIFASEDFASFSAVWLLMHRTRFGRAGTPAADCPLERWREAGAREGETARDRLRDGVEAALKALGTGLLEANPELRRRLSDGTLPLETFFNELLARPRRRP